MGGLKGSLRRQKLSSRIQSTDEAFTTHSDSLLLYSNAEGMLRYYLAPFIFIRCVCEYNLHLASPAGGPMDNIRPLNTLYIFNSGQKYYCLQSSKRDWINRFQRRGSSHLWGFPPRESSNWPRVHWGPLDVYSSREVPFKLQIHVDPGWRDLGKNIHKHLRAQLIAGRASSHLCNGWRPGGSSPKVCYSQRVCSS